MNLEGVSAAWDCHWLFGSSQFTAAGTTGPELLFQATSEQMIEAYTRVPRSEFILIYR